MMILNLLELIRAHRNQTRKNLFSHFQTCKMTTLLLLLLFKQSSKLIAIKSVSLQKFNSLKSIRFAFKTLKN